MLNFLPTQLTWHIVAVISCDLLWKASMGSSCRQLTRHIVAGHKNLPRWFPPVVHASPPPLQTCAAVQFLQLNYKRRCNIMCSFLECSATHSAVQSNTQCNTHNFATCLLNQMQCPVWILYNVHYKLHCSVEFYVLQTATHCTIPTAEAISPFSNSGAWETFSETI